MVYKTSWLASSLDYADKTQLATATERRFECSRIVLFRVLLDHRVCKTVTTTTTKITYVVVLYLITILIPLNPRIRLTR